MGGLFIVLFVIWAIHYWYAVLGMIVLFVAGCFLLDRWDELQAARRREAADRLRHEQARQQIQRVKAATARAMVEAARGDRS